jgi:A/G-specific adenine glycosylase
LRDASLSDGLLDWYDANARVLPWRVSPEDRAAGVVPDPYRVWLSEIMLQQTTVAAVRDYFRRFTALWPTVEALAAAEDDAVMGEWAGLGYYARARNLLKCARVISASHGGRFPQDRETLLTLPGIGPYTASAIAAIAFDRPETVVDGNVERVVARLFAVETPLPKAKAELTALARTLTPTRRPGDFAQAMMDLGATLCTPRSPACGICPWVHACEGRRTGVASSLPRKNARKPKPVRYGIIYVARRADGAWLLERRPQSGLLGGMLGWPTTDWSDTPMAAPPADADWRDPALEVRHTFTHFHLLLNLRIADLPLEAEPARGAFVAPDLFRPSDLPTVMRKAHDLASSAFVTR